MKKLSVAFGMLVALSLASCGGSGGGTQPASNGVITPPVTSTENTSRPPWNSFAAQPQDPENIADRAAVFETDEYKGMGALTMINASMAYARGATGAGVTVGVIDSGVYDDHLEFAAGSGTKITFAGSDYSGGTARTDDAITHGTGVAGVIAANRDSTPSISGFDMHGVAFEASINAYEIPLSADDDPSEPIVIDDITFGDDNYFANRFNTMTNEAEIINLSFGFSGIITSYTQSETESGLRLTLEALRQAGKARGDRSIFVVAAGNAWNDTDDNGDPVDATSPELLPGLPYLFPELKDHMLAVVAVDSSGEIAYYSNHCGVAADFCLAAPGGGDANGDGTFDESEVIWAPTPPPADAEPNSQYYTGNVGTSFAAPIVSGSLALLKQMFPTVGNYELANRLLVTANKTGIYSDTQIYGQGLLDLDAATRPVGATAVATGVDLNSGMMAVSDSTATSYNGTLGVSLDAALSGRSMAVFDELGFPFYTNANQLVTQAPSKHPAAPLHRQSQMRDGKRIQVGTAQRRDSSWGRSWDNSLNGMWNNGVLPFDQTTDPRREQQPDYVALQWQDSSGSERFAGVNANPGWFFGVYADSGAMHEQSSDDSRFAAPWLNFARNGLSSGGAIAIGQNKLRFGLFEGTAQWYQAQPDSDARGTGALLEYSLPTDRLSMTFQGGYVRELDTFLGTAIGPALGQLGESGTFFTGINGQLHLTENWQSIVTLYQGNTEHGLKQYSGLLTIDDNIRSSAWSFGVQGQSLWQDNDRLSIYWAQPLRIDNGRGELRLATGRTVDRQVTYEQIAIDLRPPGREQQLELHYQFSWSGMTAAARAEYIYQPDHTLGNRDYAEITFSVFRPIGR